MRGTEERHKRSAGQGWLTTLLGVIVLIAGGFGLGLVVGVISEEPELVVGHVAGRSTEIEWSAASGAEVAAARSGRVHPEGAGPRTVSDTVRPGARAAGETEVDHAGYRSGRELPPVAAPAPSPVRTSGFVPGSKFTIQVGAFGDSGAAKGVAHRLRANGYRVSVISPESDDRWRVRVGPIGTRAEAEQTARRLKLEENLPTWILRARDS